ncbi:cyclic pyranopterin monophosphate synthase MoaC [Salidesulfovibrio onnuriiensis]|uniref:cyclic pyranopterin monophosphate synthase MoaC n=1 Tax=Salidesulfovibrio onnuriiensis TaxID=2583823 RepID=UPI00202ADF74|nr:cyclic pyranopterin monophosphate synthase MoaC [Salidesulfovibrio onnuriiensis]
MADNHGFSHMDSDGNARMVDVSAKDDTKRMAIVRAVVRLSSKTLSMLLENALPKGDVLTTAKIAGIQAAKQTHHLIPMCHPLSINYVDVRFEVDRHESAINIEAEVRTTGKTGVEMEALIAAQVAAATIYDMCKAVQKDILITDCRLVYKSGGKSGEFRND